jgi:hypothetical protein
MNKKLKQIFLHLFWIGFILNLIWELPQCWLYPIKVLSSQHLWFLFLAVLGDALAVLFVFFAGTRIFKTSYWILNLNPRRSTYALGMGFLVGVVGETVALKLGWWSYGSFMPEIPIVNVGLFPVVQMTLLPYATIVLVGWILNRKVDYQNLA